MKAKTTGETQPPTAAAVRESLQRLSNREKAEFFPRFFKSDPENRSEGDLFLGVTVPEQRMVAQTFRDLPLLELERLLAETTHEFRLTALIILVNRFTKSRDVDEKRRLQDFYLAHLDAVNYWDLDVLRVFLQEHAAVMPRVTLRYSIEKMAPEERGKWLGMKEGT